MLPVEGLGVYWLVVEVLVVKVEDNVVKARSEEEVNVMGLPGSVV